MVSLQPHLAAHRVALMSAEELFHAPLTQVGAGEAEHVTGAVDGRIEQNVCLQ